MTTQRDIEDMERHMAEEARSAANALERQAAEAAAESARAAAAEEAYRADLARQARAGGGR